MIAGNVNDDDLDGVKLLNAKALTEWEKQQASTDTGATT